MLAGQPIYELAQSIEGEGQEGNDEEEVVAPAASLKVSGRNDYFSFFISFASSNHEMGKEKGNKEKEVVGQANECSFILRFALAHNLCVYTRYAHNSLDLESFFLSLFLYFVCPGPGI